MRRKTERETHTHTHTHTQERELKRERERERHGDFRRKRMKGTSRVGSRPAGRITCFK